jgi:glycosyltransferase 2 family protein
VVKTTARKWTEALIKYGLGFGLLGFVISKYWDPKTNPETGAVTPGIGQLLQGPIAFEWLAVALLLLVSAAALQIYRWYLLVRALDLPFAVRDAYRLSLVGIFFNTFIPGSIGGDLVKALFIARAHPERKTRAVASVIADRALGLFGLILFVAVLGSVAWAAGDERILANPDLQRIVKVMAVVAVVSVIGFLLLGLLPQRRVDRFSGRLKSIPKVGTALSELWGAVWMYRQRPKVVVLGVVLSAASHFGLVFAFHCASRVFPPTAPGLEPASLSEHMVVAPIGFIAQAIPLTPGGVGVAEFIFAWLYKLSGRPEALGATARLALRLVEWLIALLAGLVYLNMRAEVREIQHEIEDDAGKKTEEREQTTDDRGQEEKPG